MKNRAVVNFLVLFLCCILLSGCGDYGRHDPMNGSCVDCYYEHRDLFERCCAFEDIVSSYNKAEKRRREETNNQ